MFYSKSDVTFLSADTTFHLPENITEMYLQNNTLEKLPIDTLVKCNRLKVIDLRNNLLSSFYPELVKKIRDNNLVVYFASKYLLFHFHFYFYFIYLYHFCFISLSFHFTFIKFTFVLILVKSQLLL